MSRYRVRLARPVFQLVIVDVEAEDQEEAAIKALSHADTIPEEDWTGAFDADNYFYDAHYVTEVEETEMEYEEGQGVHGYSVDRYTKYLLLKADTFMGEGEVLFQPWVNELSDPMLTDLCIDWTVKLEKVRNRSGFSSLERLEAKRDCTRRKPAKVIPIRRPPAGEK